jgi:hypothetical protein
MKTFKLLIILIVSCCTFINVCFAQNNSFSIADSIILRSGYLGFASWCDYNSDGKFDLFISGIDDKTNIMHASLYKNNGNNTFTMTDVTNIPNLIYGCSAWGDYNNDGNVDLLTTGTKSGSSDANQTKLFKNNGNGNFQEISTSLPQIGEGYVEWVDMNNDGKLDVFIMGINNQDKFEIGVYQNMGNDSFVMKSVNFKSIYGSRGNFSKCQAKWADFDNDGLKDVVISMGSSSDFDFRFYKNLGNFTFKEINIGLPKLNYVSMAVGDINQDGLIDLAFIGSKNQTLYSTDYNDIHLFINKGNLSFDTTNLIHQNGVFWNTMEMADFNNDGFPDILYFGNWENKQLSLFSNNKNNTFSFTFQSIPDCDEGGALFGDFNNDHNLDILYFGELNPSGKEISSMYQNTLVYKNIRPAPPVDLEVTAINKELKFAWNKSSDDSTKASSLYYNIRIGTRTNPDSLVSSNSTSQNLKYYHLGNANMNLSYVYNNFPVGHYLANIQSIDNSYNVSDFSENLEFCINKSKKIFRDTIVVCGLDSLKLDAGNSYINYLWNTSEETSEIYVKHSGLFSVNLIDSNNCMSYEYTYINFHPSFSCSLPQNITLSYTDSIVLTARQGMSSYLWSTGDTTQALKLIGSKMGEGSHNIWAKLTDTRGCIGLDTVFLTVTMPDFISYSKKSDFTVFPNPAYSYLNLIFPDYTAQDACKLQIIDLYGKIIFEKIYNANTRSDKINIEYLPSGFYIIELMNGSNCSYTKVYKAGKVQF